MTPHRGFAIVLPLVIGFSAYWSEVQAQQGCPFKMVRDAHILVRGSAGEFGKLKFLIDTGAAITTVDSALAERLDLQTTPCEALGLLSESRQVGEARLPVLSFGSVEVRDLNVLVMDLGRLDLGRRVDVIVGLDVLRRFDLTIDYRSRQLRFGDTPELPSTASLASVAPLLTVSLEVDGDPVKLMVDTGAQDTVLFEGRVKDLVSRLRMIDVATIHHAQGSQAARRVELRSVALGGQSWKRLPAVVVAAQGPQGLELDGLLALRSLGAEQVHFDFQELALSWMP